MDEIQTFGFFFIILAYYFKVESGSKYIINFKEPLAFYRNIKDGYTTLEKQK